MRRDSLLKDIGSPNHEQIRITEYASLRKTSQCKQQQQLVLHNVQLVMQLDCDPAHTIDSCHSCGMGALVWAQQDKCQFT